MSRMKLFLFFSPIVSCLIYSQTSSLNHYDLRKNHFVRIIVVVGVIVVVVIILLLFFEQRGLPISIYCQGFTTSLILQRELYILSYSYKNYSYAIDIYENRSLEIKASINISDRILLLMILRWLQPPFNDPLIVAVSSEKTILKFVVFYEIDPN